MVKFLNPCEEVFNLKFKLAHENQNKRVILIIELAHQCKSAVKSFWTWAKIYTHTSFHEKHSYICCIMKRYQREVQLCPQKISLELPSRCDSFLTCPLLAPGHRVSLHTLFQTLSFSSLLFYLSRLFCMNCAGQILIEALFTMVFFYQHQEEHIFSIPSLYHGKVILFIILEDPEKESLKIFTCRFKAFFTISPLINLYL